VHLDGELFNQVVVFVIADVEMLAVFCQHRYAPVLIALYTRNYWSTGLFNTQNTLRWPNKGAPA
jgi:hypothetical protein